ncbi:MAG: Rid family hydrolase [Cohaesibacteraceae bacterium]
MDLRFESQPKPRFRYSSAVRMGPFVQTAGMVGLSPQTGELVGGGLPEEFRQILVNLTAFLDENNLLAGPMSATIYTTAFHRFAEINAIWDAHFGHAAQLPARSAVGVSQLPVGAQVEADFLIYDPAIERRA